jgi:Family of unknown function (DUF6593)
VALPRIKSYAPVNYICCDCAATSSECHLQHTMNISFLEDDPLDTVIHNSADGKPLYRIQSQGSFPKSTYIRHVVPGVPAGSGPLVAEVHWHSFESDTISFLGRTMCVDTFLRQGGLWSRYVVH